ASQNAIVIVAGGNGEVSADTVAHHEPALAAADVLICQLETPPDAVFAALSAGRRLGRTVVLNPAPAVAPLPSGWLPLVDYLIPNELEAAALTGLPVRDPAGAEAAARALQAGGARNVLITLGARGVLALTADGSARHYPAPAVQAVDTTAAGDTFIGGLAAQIAARAGLDAAIRLSQRAAALSVTRAGAQPSIPTLAELAA
ncbi:PfkB family carbohydrate kinase, partial [Burkholderia pseudomultivorans]|uniref:PfkB family carbohydrate kinase n=1 Tax=Burkholderia pseudomultivorans TaxID=1207504 RepID=UPI002874C1FA